MPEIRFWIFSESIFDQKELRIFLVHVRKYRSSRSRLDFDRNRFTSFRFKLIFIFWKIAITFVFHTRYEFLSFNSIWNRRLFSILLKTLARCGFFPFFWTQNKKLNQYKPQQFYQTSYQQDLFTEKYYRDLDYSIAVISMERGVETHFHILFEILKKCNMIHC